MKLKCEGMPRWKTSISAHAYIKVHEELHADSDSHISENDLVTSKQSSIYKPCGVLVSDKRVVIEKIV
jgi:hypothetical protein